MSLAIGSIFKKITRSPSRFLRDRFEQKVRQRTGLYPMHLSDPEDIFVVGYPKSGNTWMQNLAAAIAFGTDPHLTPDQLVNDLVPDVHDQAFYRRYRTPMFFKAHYLPRPSTVAWFI